MSLKSTIKTIIIVITTVTATPPEVIIMILNFSNIQKGKLGSNSKYCFSHEEKCYNLETPMIREFYL